MNAQNCFVGPLPGVSAELTRLEANVDQRFMVLESKSELVLDGLEM